MEEQDPSSARHAIPSDRAVLAMRRVVERLYNSEQRVAGAPGAAK